MHNNISYKLRNILNSFKSCIFIYFPLFFTFGPRSFIAQDEGYYALQSRWILESGNWMAPMWWSIPVFDRSIGVHWLIAFSQSIFGNSIFVAHIPSLISGFISLFFTYQISRTYLRISKPWLSPLILSLSYLWIDNLHLSTQDMPLLAIELISIYCVLYSSRSTNNIWIFFASFFMSIGFLIKSFMIILPSIALIPVIFIVNINIIKNKYFYFGIIIGLLPSLIWILFSIDIYGIDNVSLLYTKVQDLSQIDSYSASPIYYIWNIAINTFPWSIIAIIGLYQTFYNRTLVNCKIINIYPIILLTLLSLFRTKTPYYALQLAPFIAINANLGVQYLLNNKGILKSTFKLFISLIGISILIFLIFNNDSTISNHKSFIYILLSIGISWTFVCFTKRNISLLIAMLLGPYLSFAIAVQGGLFTDRNYNFRLGYTDFGIEKIVGNNQVDFLFPDRKLNSNEFSQVIRLALQAKNLGKKVENKEELIEGQYSWIHKSRLIDLTSQSFNVITDELLFDPWILIYTQKK